MTLDDLALLLLHAALVILFIRVDALNVTKRICLDLTSKRFNDVNICFLCGSNLRLPESLTTANLALRYGGSGESLPLHLALGDDDLAVLLSLACPRPRGDSLVHHRVGHLAGVLSRWGIVILFYQHLAHWLISGCQHLFEVLNLRLRVHRIPTLSVGVLGGVWVKIWVLVRVVSPPHHFARKRFLLIVGIGLRKCHGEGRGGIGACLCHLPRFGSTFPIWTATVCRKLGGASERQGLAHIGIRLGSPSPPGIVGVLPPLRAVVRVAVQAARDLGVSEPSGCGQPISHSFWQVHF